MNQWTKLHDKDVAMNQVLERIAAIELVDGGLLFWLTGFVCKLLYFDSELFNLVDLMPNRGECGRIGQLGPVGAVVFQRKHNGIRYTSQDQNEFSVDVRQVFGDCFQDFVTPFGTSYGNLSHCYISLLVLPAVRNPANVQIVSARWLDWCCDSAWTG